MMLGQELRKARAEIARHNGSSEFSANEKNPSLKEMLDQIQSLKEEMNEAKKIAMQEAAKPYIEAIAAIEARYVLYLKLSEG